MTAAFLAIWMLAICAVAVFWPQRLLATAVICSVFEGAAVVKGGGFGVAPYYFTLLLIAARCVAIRTDAKHFLGSTPRVRAVMLCTLIFACIAVAGAFILPHVFAGWTVLSTRLDSGYPAPLQFSASNLGQSIYLLLNTALLWYVTQQPNGEKLAEDAVKAVFIAGGLVIVFGLYQFVAAFTGLPFPDDILYSNDSYLMQYGSNILDMPRICSTYTEPAGMAVFLLGLTAFLTSESVGVVKPIWRWLLLIGSVAVLVLCTSSTAYIGLAVIGIWRIGTYIVKPIFKGTPNPRLIAIVILLLGVVGATIASSDALRSVIQKMVFEKDDSSSYSERSEADSFSSQLAVSTMGLGVGLGSNRASSFFNSLLSTVGVLGCGVFATAVVLLVCSSGGGGIASGSHGALAAGLLGVIGAKVMTSPDVATPCMWAMMAALLAAHAAGEAKQKPMTASVPRPASARESFAGLSARRAF